MTEQEKRYLAFEQAVNIFPPRLQTEALRLSQQVKASCEEIRLRAGRGLSYSVAGAEIAVPTMQVSADDLQEVLNRATRYSVHSFADSLVNGFVTLEGGHRLGLCGTAIVRDGRIDGVRNLSSLNLRIASQRIGAATNLAPQLMAQGCVQSTLILSPPAWGKTTLLRDFIRVFSSEGLRVGVVDERCELAGVSGGAPQFDLGPLTDIMSGGTKAESALLLLKTMSPMILAMDEITAQEDIEAATFAAHCGAAVFATAHATTLTDLTRRPLYQRLLDRKLFERIITIRLIDGQRKYEIATIKD